MRQALLKRMGLRHADLTCAGRDTLSLYARTLAKIEALDRWFLTNPIVNGEGQVAPALNSFSTLSNTASRQLAELRRVLEAMAREDARFDDALQRLAAAGAADGRRSRPRRGDASGRSTRSRGRRPGG
jgi:hypothetical protein